MLRCLLYVCIQPVAMPRRLDVGTSVFLTPVLRRPSRQIQQRNRPCAACFGVYDMSLLHHVVIDAVGCTRCRMGHKSTRQEQISRRRPSAAESVGVVVSPCNGVHQRAFWGQVAQRPARRRLRLGMALQGLSVATPRCIPAREWCLRLRRPSTCPECLENSLNRR